MEKGGEKGRKEDERGGRGKKEKEKGEHLGIKNEGMKKVTRKSWIFLDNKLRRYILKS